MKKLIALLLAALMCLSLCACGEDDTPGETLATQAPGGSIDSTTGNPEPEQSGSNEKTTAPTTAPGLELSDDLADFTVSFDGTVYQLPCLTQVFLDDGWTTGLDVYTREVEPGKEIQFSIGRGEGDDRRYLSIHVYNPEKSTRTVNECTIIQVTEQKDGIEVILAGGFKLSDDLTLDDIIGQYGEGISEESHGENWYTYSFDSGKYIFVIKDNHLSWWDIIISKNAVA